MPEMASYTWSAMRLLGSIGIIKLYMPETMNGALSLNQQPPSNLSLVVSVNNMPMVDFVARSNVITFVCSYRMGPSPDMRMNTIISNVFKYGGQSWYYVIYIHVYIYIYTYIYIHINML